MYAARSFLRGAECRYDCTRPARIGWASVGHSVPCAVQVDGMGRRAKRRQAAGGSNRGIVTGLGVVAALLAVAYAAQHPAVLTLLAALAAIAAAGTVARWHRRRHADLRAARTLGELLALSPAQFEATTAALLRALGYRDVRRVGGPGDRGVDLTCRDRSGHAVVVQCKRYAPGNRVGSPAIQGFIGMVVQHRAARGLFVTTSDFTGPAIALAREAPIPITLMDGVEIVRLASVALHGKVGVATTRERPAPVRVAAPAPPAAPAARPGAAPGRAAGARASHTKPCPACGRAIEAADRFCPHCGHAFDPRHRAPAARRDVGAADPARLRPPSDAGDSAWR